MDAAAVARLEAYFAQIGANLRDKRKRESFAMYALGLLGDGERKSVEPMAARACGGDTTKILGTHHKLIHVVGQSTWDDHAVRRVAARYAIAALSAREPVTTWVIDDTGFLKQGHESEWPDGEEKPTKFTLTTLPQRRSKKQIVRIVKERWRTERVYEELKGELGLDHYEGRSFVGWRLHVSVALCCFAFVIAERVQHFPPRQDGKVPLVRSASRPERHFEDSFITARLAIARVLASWLPRCPCCRRLNTGRAARGGVESHGAEWTLLQ